MLSTYYRLLIGSTRLAAAIMLLSLGCDTQLAGPPPSLEINVPESITVTATRAVDSPIPISGGSPPYSVAVAPPAPGSPLPAGLELTSEGNLQGDPAQLGSFDLALLITDAVGMSSHVSTRLELVAPGYDLLHDESRMAMSPDQQALVEADPRFAALRLALAAYDLHADIAGGHEIAAKGERGASDTWGNTPPKPYFILPLANGTGPCGDVLVAAPGTEWAVALAYQVLPSESDPRLRWIGAGGSILTQQFSSAAKQADTSASQVPDPDAAWLFFSTWAQAEGSAMAMPWWLGFLCGTDAQALLQDPAAHLGDCEHSPALYALTAFAR